MREPHARLASAMLLSAMLITTSCSSASPDESSAPVSVPTIIAPSTPPVTPTSAAVCPWFARYGGRPGAARLPMVIAVRESNVARVKGMLRRGTDPNEIDPRVWATPLAEATTGRCHRLVRILLDAGADPNLVRPDGAIALQAAVRLRDKRLIAWLLDAGADPSVATSIPTNSALISGVSEPEILRQLIPHVRDLDAGTDTGMTALDIAAERRDLTSARLLLDAGATASVSAARNAIRAGNTDMVALLLDSGLPTTHRDNLVRMARTRGHDDIVALLEER